MKRIVFWTCATGLAVALLLFVSAASTWAEETAMEGKEQFMSAGCNTCHSVASADIEAKTSSEKMLGPDMSGLKDVEMEALAAYLRKEVERDGKNHMKGFKGSDEELQAIVDWLGSLEAAD